MNWIALAITTIIQVVVAAYVYGKLTGKVGEHDRRHDSHDVRFKELGSEQERQWETLGRHGERISAVEARCQAIGHGGHGGDL